MSSSTDGTPDPSPDVAPVSAVAVEPVPAVAVGPVPTTGTPLPASPAATAHPGSLRHLFWWLTATVVLVDQVTKALVMSRVGIFETWTIIPGLLDFVHVQNTGVAFGVLNDTTLSAGWRTVLTTGLASLALVGIAYYARFIRLEERMARYGLSLIFGGALGNLVDRLRQGYVFDFVDFYRGDWHFWAFNVADAAINVGALLILLDLLLINRHASHSV